MEQTLSRRTVLKAAALAAGALVLPRGSGPARAAAPAGRVLIPGYNARSATVDGRAVLHDPATVMALRADQDGPATLITSVSLDSGAVRRAAFPLRGHAIAIAPASGVGVFVGMNAPRTVAFDATTLDLIAMAQPARPGWVFGGHALALPDGSVLVAERAPPGDPLPGLLSVRDPLTLRVLDTLPAHGIGPHDLRLTPRGHVAVANYGSAAPPPDRVVVPRVVAPAVTIVDLGSGRLVQRYDLPPALGEVRHLVPTEDAVFAIMARVVAADAFEQDPTADPGIAYLDAPPLRLAGGSTQPMPLAGGLAARQGISIVHDPRAGQVLATFPSIDTLAVFDAADGRCLKVLGIAEHGLVAPCGIALLPDGERYAVAGQLAGLRLMQRGSHRALPGARYDLPLFRHSHIVAA
ncbi:DUF1513 domain-containing protein [Zavarzinia sp. CC-PAN008]|uniref:DUF1513 domain-containing protein n=1 Tax=Zavarzinia sp. CC-PAN008 TaxID=3243332 RepID=UPI003F743EF9